MKKLTCSNCKTESGYKLDLTMGKHFEYTCEKCGMLVQGDVERITGDHGSFSEKIGPCRCTKRHPTAAHFWDSELLAKVRQDQKS
jgi:hypothetical protein